VAGELGLQAIYLAQLPSRLAGTLITGGLVNMMFFNFNDRDARLSEISRGWVMGKNARPLFGARWAEMLDEPLVEVRRRYRIVDPARSVS
jgi:ubiquinone biosynthesis protein Coq4